MKFKIAVCDDEPYWVSHIIREAKAIFDQICNYKIETFMNGEDLIEENKREQYDLLLIDIELPNGISGMEAAWKIRETNKKSQFIFVSQHEGLAMNAYCVDAIGYVVKPIGGDLFQRFCKKAYALYLEEQREALEGEIELEVKAERSYIKIYGCDIAYITSENKNTMVHTVEGIVCKAALTIKEMVELLGNNFILIDKGTIVNWKYVHTIGNEMLVVHYNNEVVELGISRRKYKDVYKKFFEVLRER